MKKPLFELFCLFFLSILIISGCSKKRPEEIARKEVERLKRKSAKDKKEIAQLAKMLDLDGQKTYRKQKPIETTSRGHRRGDVQNPTGFRKKTKIIGRDLIDANLHALRKPDFIGREIRKKCGPINKAYKRVLKKSRPFSGTINLEFYIEPTGGTSNVRIGKGTDIRNRELRREVVRQAKHWRFPAIGSRYSAQKVAYPLEFKLSKKK